MDFSHTHSKKINYSGTYFKLYPSIKKYIRVEAEKFTGVFMQNHEICSDKSIDILSLLKVNDEFVKHKGCQKNSDFFLSAIADFDCISAINSEVLRESE